MLIAAGHGPAHRTADTAAAQERDSPHRGPVARDCPAVRAIVTRYRLPTLVLDATGMRVGELEALTWGDVDEPRERWRTFTSKSGRPRWIQPPPLLLDAVLELCARDDRHPDRRVFENVTGNRLRTALTRASTAAVFRRSARTT